jgi:hypothetical protein
MSVYERPIELTKKLEHLQNINSTVSAVRIKPTSTVSSKVHNNTIFEQERGYNRSLLIRCKITRIISVNMGIRSITEANNHTFLEIKPND